MVKTAVRALTPLAKDDGEEAEHILELGGRQLLDEILEKHRSDKEVKDTSVTLMKVLTMKGVKV